MDNGHKLLDSDTNNQMDGSLVLHLHENESVRSSDDLLVRRLKNRERQRRYRARKRHEADLKKSYAVDQSTPMHYQHLPSEFVSDPIEVEVSLNLTSPDYLTRFRCLRDWKKDARRAHQHNQLEASPAVHGQNCGTSVPRESPSTFGESDVKFDKPTNDSNSPVLNCSTTHAAQPNRRHWKAEARSKTCSKE